MLSEKQKMLIRGIIPEYRKRSIREISDHIQEAERVRTAFFSGKWKRWCDEVKEFGRFWGYAGKKGPRFTTLTWDRTCMSNPNIKVYKIVDGGISFDWVYRENYSLRAALIDMEEIPLLINKVDEKAQEFLRDRLEGKIKYIPYRQDLLDRYEGFEPRSARLHRVIAYNRKLLTRWVFEKYKDTIYDRYNRIAIVLTVSGARYVFTNCNNKGFEMLDGNLIFHETDGTEDFITPAWNFMRDPYEKY